VRKTANRYTRRRKLYFVRGLQKPKSSPVDQVDCSALQKEIETARADNGTLKETIVRQRAEFDNFRKRSDRERDASRDFANEQMITQLLPILDNFERALSYAESGKSQDSLREGIAMVGTQLNRVLENHGLARVKALHARFDPAQHDAIATELREDLPDNTVSEELMPGYRLKDKVIRAAMVKVSKKSSPDGA
jgi:molecular chaperone GrpE